MLEMNGLVGGNAGSFELAGFHLDYGSHRLHPACAPQVLSDIRSLLGDDLLKRPRHGRIHLQGRWIHFPLQPLDLLLKLPPAFAAGVARDSVGKVFQSRHSPAEDDTFASVLEAGLGRTICQDFYFPYAQKIWGLQPEELSPTQAHRRVSAGSLSKMMWKVLSSLPFVNTNGAGYFFYPRLGYGQISEAYCRASRDAGAEVLLNSRVQSVQIEGSGKVVNYEQEGKLHSITAEQVWSTIPITTLIKCLIPEPPPKIRQAAEKISYRGMILIYLVLEQDRFSEYDAHYFPESTIPISRLSEPKNYSGGEGPKDLTVLCAELPCHPESREWNLTDEELGILVSEALERTATPLQTQIRQVVTRRVRQAYPIYDRDYEVYFDRMDQWLSQVEGLLTFGRQGLFAHDNTHHALYMAYAAADCIDQYGQFNGEEWQQHRAVFRTHVVED